MIKTLKIAFLTKGFEAPSARYRALQYIPYIEKEGHSVHAYLIPKKPQDRLKLFLRMREYDIVFFQKKLLNLVGWHILRKSASRIVYDFDDAVMFRDSNRKSISSAKRKRRFDRTAKNSDAVIAGNDYLNSFAAIVNSRSYVIPTAIDMERYTEKPDATNSDSVTIGWIGSKANILYLEQMGDILDRVHEKFSHVKLKIVSNSFFDCRSMPVIKIPWTYEEEIKELHSFDIGLMPLVDDQWARGKCGFKLLQCMAVGVPVVCSPVGINKDIVVDGKNSFLADKENEWIEKLSRLVTDVDLRKQIGKNARNTVIKKYSIEVNSKKMIEIFDSLR